MTASIFKTQHYVVNFKKKLHFFLFTILLLSISNFSLYFYSIWIYLSFDETLMAYFSLNVLLILSCLPKLLYLKNTEIKINHKSLFLKKSTKTTEVPIEKIDAFELIKTKGWDFKKGKIKSIDKTYFCFYDKDQNIIDNIHTSSFLDPSQERDLVEYIKKIHPSVSFSRKRLN